MRRAAMLVLPLTVAMWSFGQEQVKPETGVNPPQVQNGNSSAVAATAMSSDAGPTGGQPAVSGTGDVPASTEMRATLDTPLSTKTSQPGDRFTATISQPVTSHNGVVVPAGARVEGEVSESEQDKTAASRPKRLNLRLRDLVLPSGQTIPLTASLVSVNRTNGTSNLKADKEGRIEAGSPGNAVAKDAGSGAVTNPGASFGGPLKGLAIGALSGGGYVLATNGKTVSLPAQTGMVIRLDQPLNIQ